jgi:hypothetical protein
VRIAVLKVAMRARAAVVFMRRLDFAED